MRRVSNPTPLQCEDVDRGVELGPSRDGSDRSTFGPPGPFSVLGRLATMIPV